MHPTDSGWLLVKWVVIPIGILAFVAVGYNAIRVGEPIPLAAAVAGVVGLGALWIYETMQTRKTNKEESA